MRSETLFVDTNVLVYLFDLDEPKKKVVAEKVFRDYQGIRLSTQVLQEFYVAVTRKLGRPMEPEQALSSIEHFAAYPVAIITQELVLKAVRRSIDSRISLWDGLIVETALAEHADVLVTEDLQDGWKIGPMRVWNPFG